MTTYGVYIIILNTLYLGIHNYVVFNLIEYSYLFVCRFIELDRVYRLNIRSLQGNGTTSYTEKKTVSIPNNIVDV